MSVSDEIISVSEASEADLPGVLQLYAQPEIDDGAILSLEQAKAIFAQFATYPNYKLYVAKKGDQVLGSFALLIMHNLGHLGTPSAIVEDVVVDPAWQGKGIGQAMMGCAKVQAKMAGCYKLMLSSNAKRERAHAFYEQLGFERHGYSFRIDIDAPGGE